jgi:hypothetical protein
MKKPGCCLHLHEVTMAIAPTARRISNGCPLSAIAGRWIFPNSDCGDIDSLIDAQLDRVRARLKSMQALEQQLAALRGRCGVSHVGGECGILHELVAAAHGEACACHPEAPSDLIGTVTSGNGSARRKKT